MSLASQVGAMSLGRAVALGGALLVAVTLSRLLEPAVYGQYRQVWLLYGLLIPGFTSALCTALYAHLASEKGAAYLGWAKRLLWGWGLASGALLVVAAPLWMRLGGWEGERILWAFAPYFVGSTLAGVLEPVLVAGLKRPRSWVRYNLLYNLAQLGAILGPIWAGGALLEVGLALSAVAVLRALYALRAYRLFQVREPVSAEALWAFTRYLGPLLALEAVGVLARHLDQLIVSGAFDARTFAFYHNGAREVPLFTVLLSSLSAALVAHLSPWSGPDPERMAYVRASASWAARALLPAAAFLFVFAEPTMVVLYGPEYRASAAVFRIYLLLIPLRLYMPQALVLASGRSPWILRAGLLEVVVNAGLCVVLLPLLGWWGPALAALVGNLAEKITLGWWTWRTWRVGLRELWPAAVVWRYGALSMLLWVAVSALGTVCGLSELLLWALGAAALGAWLLWTYRGNPASARA
ncbi:MAG: oligosaccharide flippase family protein [Bacteroidota bacterium]|nr:oligosaccharide flippase family protein [Bacteroidota bacterium]